MPLKVPREAVRSKQTTSQRRWYLIWLRKERVKGKEEVVDNLNKYGPTGSERFLWGLFAFIHLQHSGSR